jgi:gliding motility-associated-like protein
LILGESIQLSATPGLDRYEWSPSDGLSNTTQANPLCSPTQETLYTVRGYKEENCYNQDQILVSVIREVFVPNLFSPNNDGNNDLFKVYGDGLKELTLQIFTNSGSLLYESTDIAEIQTVGWDGSSKGNPVPAGVYFWSITGKYHNGQAVNVDGRNSGLVTLVR